MARPPSPTSSICRNSPASAALQKNPFVNLEWALIADGVPAADVYKVLNTPEGVDRAFKKLDTIKSGSHLVGSRRPAAAAPRRRPGGDDFGLERPYLQRRRRTTRSPSRSSGTSQGLDWDWWAIPKGTPKLDDAYRFVAFASQPEAQAEQTKYISYGPANTDAVPKIDPAVLPDLPTAPENMKTALIVDPQFWADKGEELRERFNAWLAK